MRDGQLAESLTREIVETGGSGKQEGRLVGRGAAPTQAMSGVQPDLQIASGGFSGSSLRMAKVVLAGGSGFLGQALGHRLAAEGWEVVVLSRDPRETTPFREVLWNAETGGAWAAELEGAAAVVNLAGRSINCVHTLVNGREILESRLNAVKALAKGYARARHPPPVAGNARPSASWSAGRAIQRTT